MPSEHEILADEAVRAVESLADAFTARLTRYAIVGGMATLMRGRPRFTQDVDVLLECLNLLPGLLDDLAGGFTIDIPRCFTSLFTNT